MDNETVLRKIRKLLAMSQDNSSPEEAAIAAGMARKMMDRHQVSELELTEVPKNAMGMEDWATGTRNVPKPIGILCVAVAKLNDCQAELSQDGYNKSIRFKGMLADCVCATVIMQYLRDMMYKQAECVRGRSDRSAFRLGFSSGVARQVKDILLERNKIQTNAGTALVACKMALVNQEFGMAKYRTSKANLAGNNVAYSMGKAAGQNANLNRQVDGTTVRKIG
jgi:hypothetical protein